MKMLSQLVLHRLHHIGEGIPVDPVHDIVGLPAAHLHDIGVRDPQGVSDGDIVMPQIVEPKVRKAGKADRPPETI